MERKIGEIFEYDGEWYQCVEQCVEHEGCHSCAFDLSYGIRCSFNGVPHCSAYRSDGKPVIFKKLEKVGEPYIIGNKLIQRYKMYPTTYHINVYGWYYHNLDVKSWTIDIEIKQNKEDMEEKDKSFDETSTRISNGFKEKLEEYFKESMGKVDTSRLKPFDLEAAKQGKPVCTRDGRKARIIAFDRRLFYKNVSYPILALVERSDGEDDVCGYNEKGKVLIEDGAEYKDDLMMLPEKKGGWINICRNLNTNKTELDTKDIYNTKEEALQNLSSMTYVTTVKIEWEE